MRVIVADQSLQEAWNSFVAAQPGATPYHHWGWLEASRRAYGCAVFPLMALRDEQPVGILPLVRIRPPGTRGWLISLPYCDCCGPMAEDEATRQLLLDESLELAGRIGATGMELRQETSQPEAAGKVLMRLALPKGAQRLMRSFPPKLRSQIKKPLRDGLQAVTGGMELFPQFYWVFSRNMCDLGSPNHSRAWFQEILRAYGEAARVTVVSLPDGGPAAAAIWLVQGDRAFNPWASSLRTYNRQCPNMLLYWTMLSQAADAGLAEFDLGRSSIASGTYRFKQQWGAREHGLLWRRFDPVTRQSLTVRNGQGPSRARLILASCWRRLPISLANAAGPVFRRYISL